MKLRQRVLASFILAGTIFVVSALYLAVVHGPLVEAAVAKIEARALMTSGFLGEGSIGTKVNGGQFILPSVARGIIRRIASLPAERVLVFDNSGKKIADSKFMIPVTVEIPPPLGQDSDRQDNPSPNPISLVSFWLAGEQVPTYGASEEAKALYDLTKFAVNGEAKSSRWRSEDGEIMVVAAAPVQRFKQIQGAVLILSSQNEIDQKLKISLLRFLGVFIGGTIFGIILLSIKRRITS
jgi:two-component system, OmpR family, sensor histidine kinase ChvG